MAESVEDKEKLGERRNLKPGLPLNRKDSGYISPVTPSSEHSTPSRTPFHMLGGNSTSGGPGRSSIAPSQGESAITTDGGISGVVPSNNDVPPQPRSVLVRRLSTPVLDVERTPADLYMLQHALQCRECHAPHPWGTCNSQYCLQIKAMWDHWYKGACTYKDCGTCQLLVRLLEAHSNQCKEPEGACPVQGCHEMRKRNSSLAQFLIPSKEESSQTDEAPISDRMKMRGRGNYRRRSSLDSNLGYASYRLLSNGLDDTLPADSPEMQRISDRAAEIVEKLDQEEPLLPHPYDCHDDHPSTYYSSLHQLQSLYSISEDRTPTDGHFQSFPSGFGSFGQGPISGEVDGIINLVTDAGGAPSMGGNNTAAPGNNPSSLGAMNSRGGASNLGATNNLGGATSNHGAASNHGGQNIQGGHLSLGAQNSLGGEQDDATSYPNQVIKFQLRTDILTVGPDSHYYQSRDYNAADACASGGFGSVHFCKDLTTQQMFAMKHNSKDDAKQIESMHTEASLLSKLGEHDHVIQMYGAVMDEQECAFQPPRVYKMMMELAEHGNLAGMLVDEENCPNPLEADQSLYYFRQLLLGVKFLHDNSVLHLDIKSLNLLIFNEGKTLKLCDFGTAMRMDSVASSSKVHCCMTPLFAAPEICREDTPRFSADIWSCMCVLVEMVTGQRPWHKIRDDGNQYSVMFAVGSYRDELMETDLIPCVESLSPELVDLMRLVFRANHKQRSTALDLLNHPLIINAGEYESQFDGYGDEYDGEMDDGQVVSRTDAGASSEGCGQDMQPPLSLSHSTDSSGKRLSKDSGTGSDIEQDSLRGYSRKSSHGRNSDSGLDTPSHDRSIFFSPCPEESDRDLSEAGRDMTSSNVLHHRSIHGVLSLSPHGLDSYSLSSPPTSLPLHLHHPLPPSHTPFTPGSSLGIACPNFPGHSLSSCSSCDPQLVLHQCSCPVAKSAISPMSGVGGAGYGGKLRHSNSAPAIGTSYQRRHSLQPLYSLNSDGQIFFNVKSGRKDMRRSSYASSGPDIDSPEGRKKFVGIDSPTRKEVASQTQDLDEESEKEEVQEKKTDEAEITLPVSIRLDLQDSNKVKSLSSTISQSSSGVIASGSTVFGARSSYDSASGATASGAKPSGTTASEPKASWATACGAEDIAGSISRNKGLSLSPKADRSTQKSDENTIIYSKQSIFDDDDDDTIERDNGRRTVSSSAGGRATFYETIC